MPLRNRTFTDQFLRIYTILGDRFEWALDPEHSHHRTEIAREAAAYIILFIMSHTGTGFTRAYSAYLDYPNNAINRLGLDC